MNKDRRLYWVWCDMRYRCSKPSHKAFINYGGRGIRVCERWVTFANFIEDMGARPHGGLLERSNNNGNYEPSNCRWATRTEQNSNRRNCIYVEFDGERLTLKEASRRAGLVYRAVHKRVVHRGWDVHRALSTPIGKGNLRATAI